MSTAPSPTPSTADVPARPGPMNPGDDAPAGTPGTGENVCPRCGGSGRVEPGATCPDCGGTGRVNQGIGGG